MLGVAAVLVMLALPCWHQTAAHRIFQPGHAPTEHERRHAQRPTWLRLTADLAWLAYLVGTVAVGLVLR